MTDCEKMSSCEFMMIYGKEENRKVALAGFVMSYCKGEKQNICIRKIVCKEMGGPEHVPRI